MPILTFCIYFHSDYKLLINLRNKIGICSKQLINKQLSTCMSSGDEWLQIKIDYSHIAASSTPRHERGSRSQL
jgi:hypothetical protein